ncbi:MAG: zinc ribbon domain-containing protein [Acidobacteria bacterium]|nr:zinc ribbon domain-containing protein [Acidobacteriota bacterium]MBI3422013.1 zinc ribbon domain-containing protein [Acidobacteriota bacterium]
MFCPKCGLNQGERRFCTVCGTNLAAVSQSLQGALPVNPAPPGITPTGHLPHHQPYLPHPNISYELERQREYAKGMKMLLVGGAFLAYNILKFILSFGHSGLGFFGFVGLLLFAIGLSKVLSWRHLVNTTNHGAYTVPAPQPEFIPTPAPTSNTAQLNQTPKPVFSALPPGTRTDELEPVRRTNNGAVPVSNFAPSVTEDDTRHLPNQQAAQKTNWKME